MLGLHRVVYYLNSSRECRYYARCTTLKGVVTPPYFCNEEEAKKQGFYYILIYFWDWRSDSTLLSRTMQDTYILLSQVGFRRILGGSLEGTHAKKQTHKSVNDIDVTTPTRYHWAKNTITMAMATSLPTNSLWNKLKETYKHNPGKLACSSHITLPQCNP